MGSNSVLLWDVFLVGLLIPFLLYDRIDKETLKQKLDQTDWNALLGTVNDVD
jgi:hypothetical protein